MRVSVAAPSTDRCLRFKGPHRSSRRSLGNAARRTARADALALSSIRTPDYGTREFLHRPVATPTPRLCLQARPRQRVRGGRAPVCPRERPHHLSGEDVPHGHVNGFRDPGTGFASSSQSCLGPCERRPAGVAVSAAGYLFVVANWCRWGGGEYVSAAEGRWSTGTSASESAARGNPKRPGSVAGAAARSGRGEAVAAARTARPRSRAAAAGPRRPARRRAARRLRPARAAAVARPRAPKRSRARRGRRVREDDEGAPSSNAVSSRTRSRGRTRPARPGRSHSRRRT